MARLRAGEVSSIELVDAAIARAEKIDPAVNGLAQRDFDPARSAAATPRSGFFAGLPTLIKDESDQEGMPNQHGSDAFVSP